MKLINLQAGESFTGLFIGWTQWEFPGKPAVWLATFKAPGTDEVCAMSNNYDVMNKLETAARAGELLEHITEICITDTGEVEEMGPGKNPMRKFKVEVLRGIDKPPRELLGRKIVTTADLFGNAGAGPVNGEDKLTGDAAKRIAETRERIAAAR